MEPSSNQAEPGNIDAQTFYFRELAVATKNFRQECLLGEGGFGRVYKGTLQSTGQVFYLFNTSENCGLFLKLAYLIQVIFFLIYFDFS